MTEPVVVQTVTTVVTLEEGASLAPAVLEARRSVGPPAVDVVELTLDAVRRVDYIRHEAPRGPGQAQAMDDTQEVLTFLQDAQIALTDAIEDVPDDELPGVVESAEALSRTAAGLADAVVEEMDSTSAYLAVGAALEDVVAQWDESGSRNEMEASLTGVVAQSQAVLAVAQGLEAYPPDCPGLRDNRIRWAEVVSDRTEQLRQTAVQREGVTFDELVAEFQSQPFGEDPRQADAATRPCWAAQSPLPDAEDTLRARLDDLEQALTK